MNIKSKSVLLFLLPALFLLPNQIWSQKSGSEQPRRAKYIGGVKSGPEKRTSRARLRLRTASLGRSELAETEEAKLLERETFDLINLQRLERGLSALTWDTKLSDLAREHSRNMARHGFFSHIGLNGRTVDIRAVDSGIDGWKGIGENIAFNKGIANPSAFTVERWLLSPGHKRNMLDGRWRESGLGVAVTEDGKYFFTQIFMIRD